MGKKSLLFLLIFFYVFSIFSQKKNTVVRHLKEVIVVGNAKQKHKILGIKNIKISTNQIIRNPTNLTDLLRYNSPISFRDYGNGGVSTARFRGTSPTNTLVLWNGIPINAIGSGLTDFNSLSANTSDQIIISSGGGSVKYGSGAIGGVVRLNDVLSFKKHKDFHLFSSYGSFNTTSNFFKTNMGTGKWGIKLSTTVNYSTNDYTFTDLRYKDPKGNLLKNENGIYKNYGVNFSLGYKFSSHNMLSFYTTGYYGDRLFSAGLPNPSSASERNEDLNQRNLLKWKYSFSGFKQELNLAYLTQEYRYYNDKAAKKYDFGKSKKYSVDYSLKYRFSNKLKVGSSLIYINNTGTTNLISTIFQNDIVDLFIHKLRTSFSFLGEINYNPTKKLSTTFGFRKELNSDFSVPLSLSFAAEQRLTKNIILKTNISTNYRVPTFNELYWPMVGNLTLVPEKSIQGEIGSVFKNKNINISTSIFYIHLKNKILWLPAGGSNLWRPKNVDVAIHKGAEVYINIAKEMGNHHLNFSGNYTFTIAKNDKTQKTLPYAPKHLFNFNLDYRYKKLTVYLQNLYQSKVYINEINLPFYSLKALDVSNIGVNLRIFNHKKKYVMVGFKINNIFNRVYYFSNLRPMPGRNFNLNINYKF